MAKNEVIKTEGKTLEQIKAELKTVVDSYNKSEVASERNKLDVKAQQLKDDYNKLSLQNAYADCLKTKKPVLALIQKYTYPVVSVSVKKDTNAMILKDDGTAVFDLWDFVAWAEERNKQVTVALDWKSKAIAAKSALLKQVEDFNDNGTALQPGDFKVAVQAMFDSIVHVAGKNGSNAVVATSKNVRVVLTTCGSLNVKARQAKYGTEKSWRGQVFAFLNLAVSGKDFSTVYGDDDNELPDSAAEEEVAEVKAAAPAKVEESPKPAKAKASK